MTLPSGAASISTNGANKQVIESIAAAKHQRVGIIRARVNDWLAAQFPDSSATVEQVSTAMSNYVNRLAGGTIIYPLWNNQGPHQANLDGNGKEPVSP